MKWLISIFFECCVYYTLIDIVCNKIFLRLYGVVSMRILVINCLLLYVGCYFIVCNSHVPWLLFALTSGTLIYAVLNDYRLIFKDENTKNRVEVHPPPGLHNPGSTCFINSIIQSISRTGLVSVLSDAKRNGFFDRLDYQSRCLLNELYLIFDHIMKSDTQNAFNYPKCPIETSNLLRALGRMTPLVATESWQIRQQQQDSAEFLLWLLNFLHNVLQTNVHTCRTQEALKQLRKKHGINSDECIAHMQEQCFNQLPNYMDRVVMIESLFARAISVSELSGSNRLQCSYCTDISNPSGIRCCLTDGQQRRIYRHLPECLIFEVQRTDSSLNKALQRVLVTTKLVDFHSLELLRADVSLSKPYKLYGVWMSCSFRITESGHHFSSFVLAKNGKWHCYDNGGATIIENIAEKFEDRNVQQSIELLFYTRV